MNCKENCWSFDCLFFAPVDVDSQHLVPSFPYPPTQIRRINQMAFDGYKAVEFGVFLPFIWCLWDYRRPFFTLANTSCHKFDVHADYVITYLQRKDCWVFLIEFVDQNQGCINGIMLDVVKPVEIHPNDTVLEHWGRERESSHSHTVLYFEESRRFLCVGKILVFHLKMLIKTFPIIGLVWKDGRRKSKHNFAFDYVGQGNRYDKRYSIISTDSLRFQLDICIWLEYRIAAVDIVFIISLSLLI